MTDEELLEKLRPVFEVYQNKEYVYQSKMPIYFDIHSALEYVKEYRPEVYKEIETSVENDLATPVMLEWLYIEAENFIEAAPEDIQPILRALLGFLAMYFVLKE